MDDVIRWMAERVDETEGRLKAALNVLQAGGATTGGGGVIPDGIFRDVAGDERAIADVQAVIRHTRPQLNGSITLNELADAISKERGFGRETAKAHIRAVLLDSVIDAPKGKLIRILGLVSATTA